MDSRSDLHLEINANWCQLPAPRQKLRDRKATRRYIEKIDGSARGQLCVLYVDGSLDLIGAMRWCGENAPELGHETGNILGHGRAIGAVGFIMARSDTGETHHPDPPTISAVSKLRRLSAELDLPLLDYLVFPAGPPVSVGGP